MDFEFSSKQKREQEKRRQEAKRKLEQQRRDDAQRASMEAEHQQRELQRARAAEEKRIRAEEEALQNGGVVFAAKLKPYPSSRTDDKLELPPSALAALEQQGAIERGILLTFAVSLPSMSDGQEAASTHGGVAEFTAEEGHVGVPPRVALCLTKGLGIDTLANIQEVEVRYAQLPRPAKSFVKFQPRGEGFHAGGMQTMKMDLEHVLQTALLGHTALTYGDWFPIRHLGRTFELVVRELQPESALALLDTDLTVDLMPSEQTEAEQKAEEEKKAREEAAALAAQQRERERLEHAQAKAAQLGPEPEVGPNVSQVLVRLPEGGRVQRNFSMDDQLVKVLDWIESEPSTYVSPSEFRVVQKLPGHKRELGQAEAQATLRALGFQRRDAVFLERFSDPPGTADVNIDDEQVAQQDSDVAVQEAIVEDATAIVGPSAWSAAEDRAHEALDRRLEGDVGSVTASSSQEPVLRKVQGQELVGMFHRLTAQGMPPKSAAVASQKYAAQLKELEEMGFTNWVDAVALLDKYNGRILRVANLLSERAFEANNTAALVDSSPAVNNSSDYQQQLHYLATMGFLDEQRNVALLRQHSGRVERVIEILVSA